MENFKSLINKYLKEDIKELQKDGSIKKCVALNEIIKANKIAKDEEKYLLDHKALPMHFSGNPESNIVFVELNPGRGKLDVEIENNKITLPKIKTKNDQVIEIDNMETYFEFCKSFGTIKAEDLMARGHKITSFDRKQLCFFSGFDLFDLSSKNREFCYDDMKKVRNDKLQLEIVPYSSNKFNFKYFNDDFIKQQMENIMEIINLKKRKYVFITGNKNQIEGMFSNSKKFLNISNHDFIDVGKKKYIAVKKINETFYCFLSSYKMLRFNDQPMVEYGKKCKDLCEKYD